MVNSLLLSEPQGLSNEDMQPYIIKQSISDYMKNVEKTIDILVSYYEKEMADLNVEISNMKEKNEEYRKELTLRKEVCSKCQKREATTINNTHSVRFSSSKLPESKESGDNLDSMFVAEISQERAGAKSKELSHKKAKKSQSTTKCTESFVPETCDYFLDKFATESFPHLPQESSTPLVPKMAPRKIETSRRMPKEHEENAKKDKHEQVHDFKRRPSIEETVLEGSLMVLQSLRDRKSLPNFTDALANAEVKS